MPKRFIGDFLVESDLLLTKEEPKLAYVHPQGEYEIAIANSGQPPAGLSIQIVFSADTIEEADERSKPLLRKFLHLLSFAASSQFKISRIVRLIDWTPGLDKRDAYFYSTQHQQRPIHGLAQELMETVGNLQKETTPLGETALRWFANGVGADIMEDQFQYFWFVVETVAVALKGNEKVTDKCQDQKCGGDLICSSCGKTSTHKPFNKHAIELLLKGTKCPDKIIDFLFRARNALMHGRNREDIEQELIAEQPKFKFDRLVDFMGKAAWHAVMLTFTQDKKQFNPGPFLLAESFVSWSMTAKAHAIIGLGGDPDNPKIEDALMPEISILSSDADGQYPPA